MSQSRQLAAIMFTDVVGYTSMMAKSEKTALESLQKVRDILKPLIAKYNGKFQKEIGDGTLSSFSSSVDAVNCALDFQRAVGEESFKIRIGLHVGEVTMTDDDIFGDGVNIASRIEPLAPAGGIYITDRVYEDISNKPEIKTALVGTRSLKNVERPIQVYTLVGEGLPEPPKKPVGNTIQSFISDLWKRRMPQIVLLYLLIAFMMVQIVRWILDKFMLSPNWFDLSWILLLSLLPSVAFMAYYHGLSGMDKWVRKEKIFVSANFGVSVIILFFLFQGKDLGATTLEVTVQDEQGNTVQRIVPKNEFIKNIAVFNFENYGDLEEAGWLSSGINLAILADLDQDMFIQPKGTESFYDELIGADVERIDDVDFNLKRRIARDLRMDYILSGGYDLDDADYQINTQLHEVENGKLIAEHTYSGRDLFGLIDEITVQVKKDLQLPDSYIESVEDLPISNLLTTNISAYKDFTLGTESAGYRNDYEGGTVHFHNSLDKDPNLIQSTFNLAAISLLNNQMKQASEYIESVMDKIYMLPERDQFLAKSVYYLINEEQEKRLKVLEMWIELYPQDVDAYNLLVQIYRTSGQLAKAEEVLKNVLLIDDNRGNFYVDMAQVLMVQGKNEEALGYYNLYAEKYPDQSRSFSLLGDYYFDQGNYPEAEKQYEKSILLASDNIQSIGQIAIIKERQGAFEEAEKIFDSALQKAKTTGDSMTVYSKMMDYALARGQIQKVIDLWEQSMTIGRREFPPFVISIFRITRLYWYFLIDQSDEALSIVQKEEEKLSDSFKNVAAYGYINYYLNLGDIPKAEAEFERIEEYVSKYGSSGYIETYYEAEILSLKEKYSEALEKYEEFKAVNVFFSKDILDNKIAQCYVNLKEPDKAKQVLEDRLGIHPYQASAHLLLAQILIDDNKIDEARGHLIIANQVWENADEEYKEAQEALKLYEELR